MPASPFGAIDRGTLHMSLPNIPRDLREIPLHIQGGFWAYGQSDGLQGLFLLAAMFLDSSRYVYTYVAAQYPRGISLHLQGGFWAFWHGDGLQRCLIPSQDVSLERGTT